VWLPSQVLHHYRPFTPPDTQNHCMLRLGASAVAMATDKPLPPTPRSLAEASSPHHQSLARS
ncbi:hypothetical protein KUCAC02_025684, partial [Chaenocephalus aceratus]